MCRLGGISPDGDRTFDEYFRSAFSDEAVISGRQPTSMRAQVSVIFKEIDVDCSMGTGSWKFVSLVTVANSAPYIMTSTRQFEGSFAGVLVYERARKALVSSIQKLIREIMEHLTFKAEFGA